jgi:lysophospholipase L1-like esterase
VLFYGRYGMAMVKILVLLTFTKGTMVDTFTMLCMGNSHTAGFPDHDPWMGGDPTSSYQFWLNKGLVQKWPDTEFTLINEGMCGATSRGIVTRLFRALQKVSCNLVILAGGTNDLGMVGEKSIIANLEQGYELCREKKIPLIITTIPPISLHQYTTSVTLLNDAIRSYAERHTEVSIADWYRVLQDDSGFLAESCDAGDGVHLSREGYKRIGSLMVPLVCAVVPNTPL